MLFLFQIAKYQKLEKYISSKNTNSLILDLKLKRYSCLYGQTVPETFIFW